MANIPKEVKVDAVYWASSGQDSEKWHTSGLMVPISSPVSSNWNVKINGNE